MNDGAVNVIHAALSEELFDADGDPLELEVLPGLTEAEIDALQAKVRAFAAGLPSHFQVIDLRLATPGMGFSRGRYGPKTQVRRHGWERIFAYGKPQEGGWWGKLFGRRKG